MGFLNKKIITAVMTTAMISGLTSCGNSTGNENTEIGNNTSKVTETDAVTEISENTQTVSVTQAVTTTVSSTKTTSSETSAVSSAESTVSVTSYTAETKTENSSKPEETQPPQAEKPAETPPPAQESDPADEPKDAEGGDVNITLSGSTASCSSSNVSINGSNITIQHEGTYILSGDLSGQITVNAGKEAKVDLVLNGVNISNSSGSAIYVESVDKIKIRSSAGTSNCLSDGGASEACIYSKDDLTLKGDGMIEIKGNVKNGVYCKNTLKIVGGIFSIDAPNNALVGKDKVNIETGSININCGKDGIRSSNETEAGKGVIIITGGEISVNAGDDALQAVSGVDVSGCRINVNAEGKKVNCDVNVNIAEGCIYISENED